MRGVICEGGVGERRTEGLRAIESELLSEIERDAEVAEWAVLCLLKQEIMVKNTFFFFPLRTHV